LRKGSIRIVKTGRPDFRGDEKVLTLYAACTDRFANLGFISIHGRRIDVSVAVPDGPADRVDDFFAVRGVTPKAISRHDRAVIQRHGLRYVANAHGCSP
jgi:hypothetical protein